MTRKVVRVDNISQLPEVLQISKAWLFDPVTGWVLPEHRTQRGMEVWTSSPSAPGVSYLLVAPGEGDPLVPPPPPPPLAVATSIRASAEAAQRAAAQLYIDDPDARAAYVTASKRLSYARELVAVRAIPVAALAAPIRDALEALLEALIDNPTPSSSQLDAYAELRERYGIAVMASA